MLSRKAITENGATAMHHAFSNTGTQDAQHSAAMGSHESRNHAITELGLRLRAEVVRLSHTKAVGCTHCQADDCTPMAQIALDLQQQLILSELQQGDPVTSNAYASHCAGVITSDLAYALCLARIHKDAGLLQQALEQLDALLGDALRPFCEAEAVRRIADLRTHSEVVSCA